MNSRVLDPQQTAERADAQLRNAVAHLAEAGTAAREADRENGITKDLVTSRTLGLLVEAGLIDSRALALPRNYLRRMAAGDRQAPATTEAQDFDASQRDYYASRSYLESETRHWRQRLEETTSNHRNSVNRVASDQRIAEVRATLADFERRLEEATE